MTDKETLDEFGCSVMRMVRDRSIDRFDKIQSGTLKSQRAIELHNLLSTFDDEQKKIIKELLIESIDNTIFNFLFLFEEDDKKEILVSGKNITEISDGLSGELFTKDGWISRFSKNQ
ncbi:MULTISPECIES: hypothetical protein [unclassified Brenneria]|uniref:hypothetical protein n=1 Tax=unclassified Brenneria TaxID=2634434 RepID=UPI0029C518BA|nr:MULTISPECIES: hypothetical protein [unclassified Brenneria]MDX5630943.1 hypothetical protein [Brenneria sp. L3-3Z]MDX5698024.1 hypothetical protein [Brenneria sp. L4-2C]